MRNRPNIIDSQKASSHPLTPGRFYTANVTSVNARGLVTINIPALGINFGPVLPIGSTPLNKAAVGDVVTCTFVDEFLNEMLVFGSAKFKDDIWASKELFEDLVSEVAALKSQVNSLQSQLNSHSH